MATRYGNAISGRAIIRGPTREAGEGVTQKRRKSMFNNNYSYAVLVRKDLDSVDSQEDASCMREGTGLWGHKVVSGQIRSQRGGVRPRYVG